MRLTGARAACIAGPRALFRGMVPTGMRMMLGMGVGQAAFDFVLATLRRSARLQQPSASAPAPAPPRPIPWRAPAPADRGSDDALDLGCVLDGVPSDHATAAAAGMAGLGQPASVVV
eukprot:5804929-Prymnesium_polylepis.1